MQRAWKQRSRKGATLSDVERVFNTALPLASFSRLGGSAPHKLVVKVGLFFKRGRHTLKIVRDDRNHRQPRCRGWRLDYFENGRNTGKGFHETEETLQREVTEGTLVPIVEPGSSSSL